jgi:hypothetical protein
MPSGRPQNYTTLTDVTLSKTLFILLNDGADICQHPLIERNGIHVYFSPFGSELDEFKQASLCFHAVQSGHRGFRLAIATARPYTGLSQFNRP